MEGAPGRGREAGVWGSWGADGLGCMPGWPVCRLTGCVCVYVRARAGAGVAGGRPHGLHGARRRLGRRRLGCWMTRTTPTCIRMTRTAPTRKPDDSDGADPSQAGTGPADPSRIRVTILARPGSPDRTGGAFPPTHPPRAPAPGATISLYIPHVQLPVTSVPTGLLSRGRKSCEARARRGGMTGGPGTARGPSRGVPILYKGLGFRPATRPPACQFPTRV